MFLFNDWDEHYIQFVVSNVMVLKAMHDKGYDVKEISPYDRSIFFDCLDVIFKDFNYENITPEYDKDYADSLGDEDDEESLQRTIYEDFCERCHYKINLFIPEVTKMWPFSKEELLQANKTIKRFVWDIKTFIKEEYFPEYAIYHYEWLKDGICLYMYDVGDYYEGFPESQEILEILKFLELLKQFQVKRKENKRSGSTTPT